MHAIVTTVTVEESALDPDFKVLRGEIIPRVKQLPGFVSGTWLAPIKGKGQSIVVFESEDAARSAAELMGVKPGASITPGVTFDTVDCREVGGYA